MSRNKGKNTGPELKLRHALWHKGLRYRLNYPLTGKPDLVFVSARTVIFVDGCFWHGCSIHRNIPEKNRPFWEKKIRGNIERDKKVTRELEEAGWAVVRIWEHELGEDLERVVDRLATAVQNRS